MGRSPRWSPETVSKWPRTHLRLPGRKNSRGRQRAVQGMRPRSSIRNGGRVAGPGNRQAGGFWSGVAPAPSRDLPGFWRWSDGAESHAILLNRLHTVFGWTVRFGPDANPRSLRNFPCQANGAEMVRLACCLPTESGINIVSPVHDALMVEGPELRRGSDARGNGRGVGDRLGRVSAPV